jgi:hypothetical protein
LPGSNSSDNSHNIKEDDQLIIPDLQFNVKAVRLVPEAPQRNDSSQKETKKMKSMCLIVAQRERKTFAEGKRCNEENLKKIGSLRKEIAGSEVH